MTRRSARSAPAVLVAVALLAVPGCRTGRPLDVPLPAPQQPAPQATLSATPSPTLSPTPSPTPSPTASPTPTATATPSPTPPPVLDRTVRYGEHGPAVLALQQLLTARGFWLGEPDGRFGLLTQQALWAHQALSGRPLTTSATPAAMRHAPTLHPASTQGRVLEIDLARQVLLIVQDGHVEQVLHVSTGSGRYYVSEGATRLAVTSRGHFAITWRYDGYRVSALGVLYRPAYFHGGIAIHGYSSVPPFPASHGCVRVSKPAMDWLWATGLVEHDTPVWVR